MFAAIMFDSAGKSVGGYTSSDRPDPLPPGETPCTAEQAMNFAAYRLVNGVIEAVPLSLVDQARAMLSAGLQVTSRSTPAINGTYACDDAALARLGRLCAVTQRAGGAFPGGLTAVPWLDAAGKAHSFPAAKALLAFEAAMTARVVTLDLIIASGTGSLPPPSVAID